MTAVMTLDQVRAVTDALDGGAASCISIYWIRVGAAVGLLAIAAQEAFEFSLQIPATALLFCTLAAVALTPVNGTSRPAAVSRDNIQTRKGNQDASLYLNANRKRSAGHGAEATESDGARKSQANSCIVTVPVTGVAGMRAGLLDGLAGTHSRAMAPHPPNLAGTLLARHEPQLQMDLKEMDRFHSPSGKDDLLDKDDA